MVDNFYLCDLCLQRYRDLQYDPVSVQGFSYEPFNAVIWMDEHPPNGPPLSSFDWETEQYFEGHEQCKGSVLRLVGTRTRLWLTGKIPDDRTQLWAEAQRLLPDWPGFRRLELSPEQMQMQLDPDL